MESGNGHLGAVRKLGLDGLVGKQFMRNGRVRNSRFCFRPLFVVFVSCCSSFCVSRAYGAPDVIVSGLTSTASYGNLNGMSAFAISTVSCNIGDSVAQWNPNSNQHPVISQNLFRLKDDRFEHVGMAWVKHGFLVINAADSDCGTCPNPGSANVLRVGCSDLYSAGLNGDRMEMGPKSQVNAFTGFFPPPPIPRPGMNDILKGRLLVHTEDVIPAMNKGARYFMESHYVTADDAAAGNAMNNASYRELLVSGPNGQGLYTLSRTGPTVQELPAIRVWKTIDPDVVETDIQIPNEGLFILAAKASQLGTGFWQYEYALHNFNSDRSGGSFSVPVPTTGVSDIGFHDVEYHSGEPIVGTDWTHVVNNGMVTWSTTPYDAQNDTSNALRWDSTFNFRFQSGAEPITATVTLGLFKTGFPEVVTATSIGPRLDLIDCNQNALADACDLDCGPVGGECDVANCGLSADCDENGIPDDCQLGPFDCNDNLLPDVCDLLFGTSTDCNQNEVPDECEPDCDGDGLTDECDGSDADADGFIDCDDVCPLTTPADECVCPPTIECCCPLNFCFEGVSPEDCVAAGCVPECLGSRCREGCLPGDGDGDGDQDLADFAALQNCFSGPRGGPPYVMPDSDCLRSFDEDGQEDVDSADFKKFHALFVDVP